MCITPWECCCYEYESDLKLNIITILTKLNLIFEMDDFTEWMYCDYDDTKKLGYTTYEEFQVNLIEPLIFPGCSSRF